MRLTIVANPRSGRGKALGLAGQLDALLRGRGHTVFRPDLTPDLDIRQAAEGSDRLVVVGGDGTIHHAAGPAAEAGVPVYHLATGTENLFARYFRMPRDPVGALEALEQEHPPFAIDLGSVNGVPFCLMCSLGVDASVIHRVEDIRGSKGGHLAYIRPILCETFRPRPAHLTIRADGQTVEEQFTGTAIVTNIPAYALRMDPNHDADPADGRLDLALLPSATSLGTAWDFLRCKVRSTGVRRLRADRLEICATRTSRLQIDGERPRASSILPATPGPNDLLRFEPYPTRLLVHAKNHG